MGLPAEFGFVLLLVQLMGGGVVLFCVCKCTNLLFNGQDDKPSSLKFMNGKEQVTGFAE